MSANIYMQDGEASVMLRKDAWHQLGTVVGQEFSLLDAVAADLPILRHVEKVSLSTIVPENMVTGDDQFAAVRFHDGHSELIYAGHGSQWTPYQVIDACAFGELVVGSDGMAPVYESLGGLGERGERYFATYKLDEFTIGDHEIRGNFTIAGSFDGSLPLTGITSRYVVVCSNTMAGALATGQKHYVFKHTSGIVNRVEEAKRALNQARENQQSFRELAEGLVATKVTGQDYTRMLNELFPVTDDVPVKTRNANGDARDKVNALWRAESGQVQVAAGVEGTAWAFVQAVNTYEQWGTPIRKTKGRSTAETRALRQLEQVIRGRQPFTDQAIALVGAAR